MFGNSTVSLLLSKLRQRRNWYSRICHRPVVDAPAERDEADKVRDKPHRQTASIDLRFEYSCTNIG